MDYPAILNQYEGYLEKQHPLHVLEQTKDPYVIGVAVILSGNCTDAAVNKMLPNFLNKYPTPASVISATRDDMVPVMPGISHSGSKSDYIRNWASFIISNNGKIPNSLDSLIKVSGIGRKTGAIILYRVYGSDEGFPLDTHCLRVLERLGWFPEKKPKSLEKALLNHFPVGTRHKAHLILTHHGRNCCKPQQPNCPECKLAPYCNYWQSRIRNPQ